MVTDHHCVQPPSSRHVHALPHTWINTSPDTRTYLQKMHTHTLVQLLHDATKPIVSDIAGCSILSGEDGDEFLSWQTVIMILLLSSRSIWSPSRWLQSLVSFSSDKLLQQKDIQAVLHAKHLKRNNPRMINVQGRICSGVTKTFKFSACTCICLCLFCNFDTSMLPGDTHVFFLRQGH